MKQNAHRGLYGVFTRHARDPMSSYTHLLAAVSSVCIALALAIYSHQIGGTGLQTLSVGIFGLSLTALYTASSVFHYYNHGDADVQLRLRKLDHSMIYVLIAGSYTPFLIRALGTGAARSLAVVWGIALVGIVIKMVWMNAPRWLSTVFYLALGWCVIFMPEAIRAMPLPVMILTAAGGLSYTFGAVIYATKKPNLGEVWGFHEIFHLFTMLGSLLQVIAVFLFLAMR